MKTPREKFTLFKLTLDRWRHRSLMRARPTRIRLLSYAWPMLPDMCPCDVHLSDYLRERNLRSQAIFHFGSGAHHSLGLRNAADGLGNDILAITAAPSEHASYIKAIADHDTLADHYKVLLADIYTLNASLLPMFDIVTLFHLCEFAPAANGQLDDRKLLALFLSRLKGGGLMAFYSGSAAAAAAQVLVDEAVRDGKLTLLETYQSLRIYRRGPGQAAA